MTIVKLSHSLALLTASQGFCKVTSPAVNAGERLLPPPTGSDRPPLAVFWRQHPMGLRPRCFQTRQLPLAARSPPPPPSCGRRRARRGEGSSSTRDGSQQGCQWEAEGIQRLGGGRPGFASLPRTLQMCSGWAPAQNGQPQLTCFSGAPIASLQGGSRSLTAPLAGLGHPGLPRPPRYLPQRGGR